MNSIRVISILLSGFLYLLFQILVLKNLVLFGTAFCFLYVTYIILLPLDIKTIPVLLISFFLGIGVDLFYDTLGIHTAALLVIAFIRHRWLLVLVPTGGYEDDLQPSMLNMGLGWFLSYSVPLVLIHHVLFFYIESLGTDLFLTSLQKVIASVIFVLVMSIIVQLLFYRRRRGI
ncbi:rod shape-determining protein MreD [Aquiflexum gelatinilyticum]|uniref:rod shape-determining protein MreD n=1 Tax=Aquiflexum gelatinilyticum TaxID=2961943 RepID=UPI00216A62BD|nr:rod shape-determining protein MreD [Aquiflexum gelatinilyticum]MCS4433936.1 rod shape-determining protein MreD [Aquiflexum gelatinilyticum]